MAQALVRQHSQMSGPSGRRPCARRFSRSARLTARVVSATASAILTATSLRAHTTEATAGSMAAGTSRFSSLQIARRVASPSECLVTKCVTANATPQPASGTRATAITTLTQRATLHNPSGSARMAACPLSSSMARAMRRATRLRAATTARPITRSTTTRRPAEAIAITGLASATSAKTAPIISVLSATRPMAGRAAHGNTTRSWKLSTTLGATATMA
mmetsp:Transcript_12542/g.31254  ORF Transcript_12542/g.31254 Transcript_12542/m.31254 type:complete len:218 (+) Transcript_12542:884-1537(+)